MERCPLDGLGIDIELAPIQIAHVPRHVGSEERRAVRGRIRVEMVDVEVGVTPEGARRRRKAREGRRIDEEPGVGDLDDDGVQSSIERSAVLSNDQSRLEATGPLHIRQRVE